MDSTRLLGAVVLIMMTGAIHVRAAAPALPPDAIASDTILVVHIDAAHFTPDQFLAARAALFGPEGAKVDDMSKQMKEGIDKAVAAGAEALTMVAGEPESPDAVPLDDSPVISYVQLKAGADVQAVKAALTSAMSPESRATMVFDEDNHFLVMHEKGKPFRLKPDAARTALFADALGTIGDASIQIVFIPDPILRDLMVKMAQRAPRGAKEAIPQLAASKWTTLAIMLGNTPSFSITVNTGTDADAKALIESINAGLAELKAKIAGPGPDANALLAPIVGPMIDGLRPVQSGTKVVIVAKSETVKSMANLVPKLMGAGAVAPKPTETKK